MIENMMAMYGDPDEIEKFTNDDVFKESFWNEISDQTGSKYLALQTSRSTKISLCLYLWMKEL